MADISRIFTVLMAACNITLTSRSTAGLFCHCCIIDHTSQWLFSLPGPMLMVQS